MSSSMFFLNTAGLFTLLYFGVKTTKFIFRLWRESLLSSSFDFKKFGIWAVVTGGSDGIGKSTVVELAKCGLNIVIIARTRSKLEKVAKEISKNYNVEIKIIAVDVTSGNYIYDVIKKEIQGLDIALLVNNVAVAQVVPTKLLKVPNYEEYSSNCVKANVNAMIKLTELILPNMLEKRGGMIVNVSSVLGSTDSPYFAMYGATKRLIITYTKAMTEEYGSKGVIFQCIAPAATETPLTSHAIKGNFMIPKGEEYGKYVVKAMGKSGYSNTCCLAHNLFQQMLYWMPTFFNAKIMRRGADRILAKQ